MTAISNAPRRWSTPYETTDVGCDNGSTVSDEYDESTSRFSGAVNWVEIDVGVDDTDHIGELVEYGATQQIFSAPSDPRTEQYVTGQVS